MSSNGLPEGFKLTENLNAEMLSLSIGSLMNSENVKKVILSQNEFVL